ncbi:unnamed protein product [Adineta steineri]|uniref:F-box domain-containing protein n=1 Tax=Adineta steineri TaxID=433720 RepID=A0A815LT09_9BILA|nr:unnamed protein product [Adineta steineri]CAF1412788.1 unnamed protein product [Adineta steineri]CAF3634837.1 unnamed protein product [Adineta steineri]CAF3757168.1 unnamed protein product [Adineta steineri]
MEQLPDEIWLLIYRYLHHIDILNSFTNLNNRFQSLIRPYLYNIHLNEISLNTFEQFTHNVLPNYGDHIRSLTIENIHHISFFNENNILQLMKNLESVTFTINRNDNLQIIQSWYSHLKSMQQLTQIHIEGSYGSAEIINNLNTFAPSSLTNLTVLSLYPTPWFENSINIQLNIKILKIHVFYLSDIWDLLQNLVNLEELYLSVSNMTEFTVVKKIIPRFLIKLHLEFGRFEESTYATYFERMMDFLEHFKNQLQTLILVVTSSEPEFIDPNQLQLIEKSFSHLKSFEYLIHTTHCPSHNFDQVQQLPNETYLISTKKPRRPVSFSHKLRNDFTCEFDSDLQLNELYNTDALSLMSVIQLFPSQPFDICYKLSNLRYLSYNEGRTDSSRLDKPELFSKIILQSPNLRVLNIELENSSDIFELLQYIPYPLRKINHFTCNYSQLSHVLFIKELAQFLPYVKHIQLKINFTNNYNWNDKLQFLTRTILQSRQYFRNMINLYLCMNINDDKQYKIYKELKSWCNLQRLKIYCPKDEPYSLVFKKSKFSICL